MKSKVERFEIAVDCSKPGLTRSASWSASSAMYLILKIEVFVSFGVCHCRIIAVGDDGLGFTVVTRPGPDVGQCTVYVKNILRHGAASKDGRLKPGDLILEV